jgi:hypothetical protein
MLFRIAIPIRNGVVGTSISTVSKSRGCSRTARGKPFSIGCFTARPGGKIVEIEILVDPAPPARRDDPR